MALFDKGTSKQNLLAIGAACKGLSNQQLKLVLSTKGLEYEDRELILAGMGVAEAERQQTLATLGFAAAEDKATASTFSLKGAFNSLSCAVLLAAVMNPAPIDAIVFATPIATSPASVPFKRFVLSINSTMPVVASIMPLYKSSEITLVDNDSIAAVSSFVFASMESWYTP